MVVLHVGSFGHVVLDIFKAFCPYTPHHVYGFIHAISGGDDKIPFFYVVPKKRHALHVVGHGYSGHFKNRSRNIDRTDEIGIHTAGFCLSWPTHDEGYLYSAVIDKLFITHHTTAMI